MDVRCPLFQNVATVLIGVLFLNPIVAAAAELAIDAAGGGNASLGQAANGVPIVNIATPNASGLSHNKFTDYNVGSQGLILNNATGKTQSTQLGGIILGNSNLNGRAAGLILNEVTGGNPSQLRGYTEVAGQGAHVIVANPHGITCDGCGFINTPHATLTTGKPMVENGRLDHFDVDGGEISIEGAGLNANNVEQFDLITRSAKLNAELYAQRLNIITGRNRVDASSLTATAKADDGSQVPQLAIDSSALGGMYAGAIRLVGTEAGVGVKLAGDMAASAGDIQIDANGHLDMTRTAASHDLQVNAQGITLNGDVYAGGRAQLSAAQKISIASEKRLAAAGDVQLTAAQVNNAGTVESGRRSDGSLNNESQMGIHAAGVSNLGVLVAHGGLTINAQELDNQGATIIGDGDVELNVDELANNGQIIGRQALTVTGSTLNNSHGTLASNQGLTITATTSINNTADGLILSKAGGLDVHTGHLNNAGGTLQADQDELTLSATTLDNQTGKVQTGSGALSIDADQINNGQGLLAATGAALTTHGAHLDNQQGQVQGDTLDLTASVELNNDHGLLVANKTNALIHAGAINNQSGSILGYDTLSVDAESLNNTDGSLGAQLVDIGLTGLLDNTNGLVEAGDHLRLNVAELDNEYGKLRALGSTGESRIHAVGDIYNDSGLIEIGNANFTLSSIRLQNYDGIVSHVGNQIFALDVDTVGGAGGSFISNGDLTLTAASWSNNSLLQAARLTLNIDQFEQQDDGQLIATESLTGTGVDWINGGLLSSDGSLNLTLTGDYSGYGDISSQGNFSLAAANAVIGEGVRISSGGSAQLSLSGQLFNQGGHFTAVDDMSISAAEIDNRGTIGSTKTLELNAPSIYNQGLLFSGAGMTLFSDSFSNRYGDVYSLGSLLLAKNAQGDKAGLLDNISGSIESDGDMTLRAVTLNNRKETFELGREQISGHISKVCLDCGGDKYNVDFISTEVFKSVIKNDSAAARINSGGNLDIQGGAISNQYSSLSATGDISITSTTLENIGAAAGKTEHVLRTNTGRINDGDVDRLIDNYVSPYNAQGLPKTIPSKIANLTLISDIETYTPTGILAPAIIQAGGNVTINATQTLTNSSVMAFNSPTVGGGMSVDTAVNSHSAPLQVQLNAQLPPDAQQQMVNPLTLPGFSLPTGRNGLFSINQNPNFPYLIETNPAFASLKNFLSSDYLLSRLGYNTDEIQRRLGDGLYEQRLIEQAVIARTGKRFLDGLASDEDQFRYLMDNAIASKEALNLAPGIALTAEQVAALTHDIVWMQEQEVSGQKVLVPVLYLAQANDRLAPSGALIQGQDVTLIGGSELKNGGTLRATANLSATAGNISNTGLMQANERLSLLATDSIRNAQGGIINGKDVSAIALTGDISNERTITQESHSGKRFSATTSVVDSAAGIEASNDLSLSAGRDLLNVGGTLKAGGNATLDAGRDVIIASATEEQSRSTKDKHHSWSDSSTTQHGSEVQVGGDLSIDAGRDLAVVGSTVKAGGDIALSAGEDVTIASAANETNSEYHHKGNGKKVTREDSSVRNQASVIEAGGSLGIAADNDLTLISSHLKAGNEAYLYAGNDLNVLAAQDSNSHVYDYSKKGSWGSKKTQKDEVNDVKNIGSAITTGGDLSLISEGDQRYQNAHLESGNDLTLDSGGAITFEAVKDSHQESHEKSSSDLAWTSSKGKGRTDETVRQSQLIAQGEVAIKAVDGLKIDIKQINQKSVSQTIDVMVQADPQLAWLKDAEARGDVDWQRVQEVHDHFKYSNSGLGAGAQLAIAIMVAAFVGPAAMGALGTAGLGASAAVAAGGSAVAVGAATNASISLINNRGNLGQVAKDVTSSDSLKGYAIAGVTAGLTTGVYDKMLGTTTDPVTGKVTTDFSSAESVGRFAGNQLLQNGTSTALNKALGLDASFGDALQGTLLSTLNAAAFNAVGDYAKDMNWADGSPQKIALHAIVGGLLNQAAGGDFKTGAMAAGANEALVAQLDSLVKYDPNLLIMSSQLVGLVAAAAADGDVQQGADIAKAATQYNYLSHDQDRQKNKELQDCGESITCQVGTATKWALIDAQQNIGIGVGVGGGIGLSAAETASGLYELAKNLPETMAALSLLADSAEFRQEFGDNYFKDLESRAALLTSAYEDAGWEGSVTAGVEGGRFAVELVGVLTAVRGAASIASKLPTAAKTLVNAIAEMPASGSKFGQVGAVGDLTGGAKGASAAKGSADFYVTSQGTAVPATGYRAVGGPAVEEALTGTIAPRNPTYITFDNIKNMTPSEAQGLLQLPRTPTNWVSFDTLPLVNDLKIPTGKWNTTTTLEPITNTFPEWGRGGGTQAITNQPIKVKDFGVLPEGGGK